MVLVHREWSFVLQCKLFFLIFSNYYNNFNCFDSDTDPKRVEILDPPSNSKIGDRIFVENFMDGKPDEILNPKKKIWEKLQVDLRTNDKCVAQWKGYNLVNQYGHHVSAPSLKNAPIR